MFFTMLVLRNCTLKPQSKLECDVWNEIRLTFGFNFMEYLFQKMQLKDCIDGFADCRNQIKNQISGLTIDQT